MKIALSMSGQPRDLKECYPFIKKCLIDGNDIDVYAHLWWDNSYKNQIVRFHTTNKFPDEDCGHLFKDLYHPVTCSIEPQKDFDLTGWDLENNFIDANQRKLFTAKVLFCSLSMWYSVEEAFNLSLAYGIQYDLYIRARTDLIFMYPLDFNQFDPNILYISDSYYGQQSPGDYTDWFAIGGLERMKDYVQLGHDFEKYNKNGLIPMRDFVKQSLNDRKVPHKLVELGCRLYRDYGPEKEYKSYKTDLENGDFKDWPYFTKNIMEQLK